MALMSWAPDRCLSNLAARAPLRAARLLCLSILLLAGASQVSAQPVNDIFDRKQAAVNPNVETVRNCTRPPNPVVSYAGIDYYVDEGRTVISWERRRASLQQSRRIREYAGFVQRMADAYFTARTPDTATAQCVARWLLAWARDNAFLGDVTPVGRMDTIWFGQISLGVSFLKVRSDRGIPERSRQEVGAWLASVARAAIRQREADGTAAVADNQAAWIAAAAAVAAVASNDRELLRYAVETARAVLRSATTEGTLPEELKRAGRAFSYHVWTLEPLALTALIAEANGMSLKGENDQALRRLFHFALDALTDRSQLERLAGASQVDAIGNFPNERNLGAFEIYLSLERDSRVEAFLRRWRPVSSPFTGGDWSFSQGRLAN